MTDHVRLATEIPGCAARLTRLVDDRVASRLFARDASLWGHEAEAEAAVRLGWVDFEASALSVIARAEELRAALLARSIDRFVLCGMGGSSLAPGVISQWAGVELSVLASTHPRVVARELGRDLARTAVIVSSKSGSTIETASHLTVFAHAFRNAGMDPADRIIVVTDPGSPLEARAVAAGYPVFSADPEVGGRFSALTAFGLVPACLAGADVREPVTEAARLRERLMVDSPENPALQLAAAIAAGLPSRFALGLVSARDARWGLGSWIDQLVAESTGKDGVGVLPVVLPERAPELEMTPETMLLTGLHASEDTLDEFGEDLSVIGSLGEQFLLWETATAALGRLMGIDPFNQPDVESAKVAARHVLDKGVETPLQPETPVGDIAGATVLCSPVTAAGVPTTAAAIIATVRAMVPNRGYLAVQAYLDADPGLTASLQSLRDAFAEELRVPVVLGIGPSYLHSSGQLHKGGPAIGAFLQLCDGAVPALDIPGSESGFEELFDAQSRGDRDVLFDRGRPVLAVKCDDARATLELLLSELR